MVGFNPVSSTLTTILCIYVNKVLKIKRLFVKWVDRESGVSKTYNFINSRDSRKRVTYMQRMDIKVDETGLRSTMLHTANSLT